MAEKEEINYEADNHKNYHSGLVSAEELENMSAKDFKKYVKNFRDPYNNNILMVATATENPYFVQAVLDTGLIDVNQGNNNGFTPLFIAAHQNDTRLMQLLINYGANANHADKDGVTPLLFAIANNAVDATKFLVKQGADVNHEDEDGNTPLLVAIDIENEELVDFLLSNGANAQQPNKYGLTPTQYYQTLFKEAKSELQSPENNAQERTLTGKLSQISNPVFDNDQTTPLIQPQKNLT